MQQTKVARKFRVKCPIALVLICAALLLLLLIVSLQRPCSVAKEHKHEQQWLESKEGFGGAQLSANFRWSNELKGWTLSRTKVDSKEERAQQSSWASQCLWPEDVGCEKFARKQDRIINQLLFEPPSPSPNSLRKSSKNNSQPNLIKIVPPIGSEFYPIGRQVFLDEQCPFNECQITQNQEEADAIVFQNSDVRQEPVDPTQRQKQVWIAYLLESPVNTFDGRFKRAYRGSHQFNWTATYRDDSDIITPYSVFVPFEDKVAEFKALKEQSSPLEVLSNDSSQSQLVDSGSLPNQIHHLDLIRNKQKPASVAWFASNCNARNQRLEYAKELSRFIQVDIYGRCGTHTCDKSNETGCAQLLNKNYKFYLAFENSNCRQYLTEKLFKNAYGNNDANHLVVPIVMGAPKEDYELLAPPKSFIHVEDFNSPEELAAYLRLLDQDDFLYYSYFRWKSLGRFVETKFMCRLCALLHESTRVGKVKSKKDLKGWWNSFARRFDRNQQMPTDDLRAQAADNESAACAES